MMLENNAAVTIRGVDNKSFVHLLLLHETKVSQNELSEKINLGLSTGRTMKTSSIKPRTECIVKINNTTADGFSAYRGVIRSFLKNSNRVLCYLIDEIRNVRVSKEQLYYSNADILAHPQMTTKCILDGMETFIGHRCLRHIFNEYLKSYKERDFSETFQVIVLGKDLLSSPVIQLINSNGENLSDLLKTIISEKMQLTYPLPGFKHYVKIMHMEENGTLWVSPGDTFGFQKAIKKRLERHRKNFLLGSSSGDFKNNEILLYTTRNGDKCYRTMLLDTESSPTENDANQRKARFIESGMIATVNTKNLVCAESVDTLLSVIPPQAIPVKPLGYTKRSLRGRTEYRKKLWYCSREFNVLMQIKNVSKLEKLPDGKYKAGTDVPPAEILFRKPMRKPHSWEKAYDMDTILRGHI